jgi:gluconate 2-dehydrogenase gamma chain
MPAACGQDGLTVVWDGVAGGKVAVAGHLAKLDAGDCHVGQDEQLNSIAHLLPLAFSVAGVLSAAPFGQGEAVRVAPEGRTPGGEVREIALPWCVRMSHRSRRTFLETAAVAVSGVAAGCGGSQSSFRFFTEAEARTLDAMLARIIPSDDAPGAREAGVIHYIDRQLTGHFQDSQNAYRAGLASLRGFAEAPSERQEEILREMEGDRRRRPFLDLVIGHAMQGFYGNPRHGGNRDFASWRMLGIPPVPVRGRERYEKS